MSDQVPEFDDSAYAEEQRQYLKTEGVAAYFDLILDSIGGDKLKIDPAKRELIREGFKAIFEGPKIPAGIQIPMPTLPSPYFEEVGISGDVTIWNWPALMQSATHATKYAATGNIKIWSGEGLVQILEGKSPAAKAFWDWYTAITHFNNAPYGRIA